MNQDEEGVRGKLSFAKTQVPVFRSLAPHKSLLTLIKAPGSNQRGKSSEHLSIKCTHNFLPNTQGKQKVANETFLS